MPMENMRLLSKKERTLRSSIDNLKTFIRNYQEDRDRNSIPIRMEKLDQTFDKFVEVRMQIELLTDDHDDDEEFVESVETEEERSLLRAEIQEKRELENAKVIQEFENTYYDLRQSLAAFTIPAGGSSSSARAQTQSTTTSEPQPRVKLPELKMPSFSGKLREWITFRDTFTSVIHSNSHLSAIDKFTYLRTSLTGDALKEISSIEMTTANYNIAWQALNNCYENKKLIIKSHLDALFSIKPMERESYEQLKRIVGEFETNLMMLQKMGEEVDGMSTILQHMVCQRLDSATLRNWESHHNSKNVPIYSELIEFLKNQCQVLRNIASARSTRGEPTKQYRPSTTSLTAIQQSTLCPFCSEQMHSAFKYNKFTKLKTVDRVEEVKRRSLCLNCLSPGHIARFCSKGSCHTCGKSHHTLLHSAAASSQTRTAQHPNTQPRRRDNGPNPRPPQSQSIHQAPNSTHTQTIQLPHEESPSTHTENPSINQPQFPSTTDYPSTSHNTVMSVNTKTYSNTVILSTALVGIIDDFGHKIFARALLDSGSQLSFMTQNLAQKLKYLPVKRIDVSRWRLPGDIVLADPEFHNPSSIDIILGAQVFFDLLVDGQFKLEKGGPSLRNTHFGWIISGRIADKFSIKSTTLSHPCTEEKIDDILTRFWELETCRTTSILSLEESMCEKLFDETTTRDSTGRFNVTLPKKDYVIARLGESRSIAMRRFLSLERRLDSNPSLKTAYSDFIHEYLNLKHMREISVAEKEIGSEPYPYYLPHHAVIRPDSTTTKLRVVFDASCASSSGVSLNDALLVGPVIQQDLLSIIIRFRLRKFAIVADVAKMYRMININPADYHLQRILWRDCGTESIKTFELTTVTYGTSSAPYLATKCLQRLSVDGKQQYPTAAKILSEDFYMDDLLSGVDNAEQGVKIYNELTRLLRSAGFTLRKWNSNCPEILAEIPDSLKNMSNSLEFDSSERTIKMLGLIWEPHSDYFHFTVPQWNESTEINKRIILSDFARLFDPLGLVGPVIVQAKIFLQDLWKQGCSWTEPLKEELRQWWLIYRSSMVGLTNLRIPRWIAFSNDVVSAEIHGFCDASEKAYGACVYLRCITVSGSISVNLITAKSRVAPLDDTKRKKKKMTIPRLELSSALVLSHLYEKIISSIQISARPQFWTDSTIVQCWLSSPPSRWHIFIANRVSEIQHLTRSGMWCHIAGTHNPADAISRGITPEELADHHLWWKGPDWLSNPRSSWPPINSTQIEDLDTSLLEEKVVVSAAAAHIEAPNELFTLKSTLSSLVRITALCRRFVFNCQNCTNTRTGYISYIEREEALNQLIKVAQNESFADEIVDLKLNGQVKSSSRLRKLNPHLTRDILVVGGRLENAPISSSRKHPIILDNRHPLALLIVKHFHQSLLHAGQQLLIASVRERFWPLRLRNLSRKVIQSCVRCFRVKPKVEDQLMADLPAERVNPVPPFTRVAVDYCGPFNIRFPHRKADIRVCYVAIFVCLVTKAVHCEMVSDQTTAGFLAALKRLVARRGHPEVVLCDNAKNFVGAKRELDQLRKFFNSQMSQQAIAQEAASEGIHFKFIPPRSPNFGGLWEAAVKSMKYHFKRTVGNEILTPEEFSTLLTQIEACMNSRPLIPLSNDPMDLESLTPGHFLVYRPLTAIPEPSLDHLQENTLSRWQRVQKHLQTIWKKWSTLYLSDLQNRTKWTERRRNLREGMMVLLKNENQPPLRWALGRIVAVHEGRDGNVRVVEVKTKDGTYTRAIAKICVLPIKDNDVIENHN
ncbi:uncharacterized protein LOC129780287 [Toxorhynchites rutilus septentrionalis]|uniref:uncharacterized protein LOC129780287 n=1 Tax=Toxorhynchites rutilus septentrionalis TaxID=329112 RepID=UPI0024796E30|nr:uncharacterized protein LOC129780287 [Toxorhynchites rutilus septentrionalis]